MSNAKQKLSKIIREIVQQEVEKQLVDIFGDKKKESVQEAQDEMLKQFSATGVSYTKNASLNEALNETAASDEYRTMKTFSAKDARSQFAQMQSGPPSINSMVPRDLVGKQIDTETEKALTRDYSELVKRFKK